MNKKYLETIKIDDLKICNLSYHQKRVDNTIGAEKLDLQEIVKPPVEGLLRCRIVYSLQECKVEYIPYIKRNVQVLKAVFSNTIEYDKKYEDRTALDLLFAQREECDDILIIKNGYVTDTSIANIAFYDGEKWLTPTKPLLAGTTRARLLDEKKILSADIKYEELYKFKKLALMNAMIDFDIIAQENIGDVIC
ncbi:MAG: aminotransferase class IV [Campylobacterales bacterium]|nr:aminotransferase class IV [Campylobacterales bacterium]